jgi:hypothetical protein
MKSRNRISRQLWAFGVSSLLFVHLAGAQEESVPPHAQELAAAPAEPVPIPCSDILSRADEVTADLRRMEALLEPSDEIETIRFAIDKEEDVFVALHSELDGLDPDRVSTRALEDHRLKWLELQAPTVQQHHQREPRLAGPLTKKNQKEKSGDKPKGSPKTGQKKTPSKDKKPKTKKKAGLHRP